MTDQTVPAKVKLAARRGFVRTTSQSISTALAGGVSATVIIATLTQEPNWLAIGITAGVTVASPFLAGAASYFNILAKGLPEDYVPLAVDQQFQPGITLRSDLRD